MDGMLPDGMTRRGFVRAAALSGAGTALGPLSTSRTGSPSRTRTRTLTFTEGTNAAVAVSPAGDRLILEIQGVLWSLPREGGEAAALTPADLEPTCPVWSPDGSAVAFCAYHDGGFHLWTMAPDGTGLRQLTSGPWDDRGVSWSPDGTRLAFASERGGDDVAGSSYSIWTVHLHSGELRRLTDGPHEDYDPAWHPDGSTIFFVRADRAGDVERRGSGTIVSVPAGGGDVTVRHTEKHGAVFCPAVSHDGRIAYVHLGPGRLPEGASSADLCIDGTAVTTGEDVSPRPPSWGRAGELFYVADGRLRVRRNTTQASGAIREAIGEAAENAAEEIPFTARLEAPQLRYRRKRYHLGSTTAAPVRGIQHPALSPDGTTVAFAALDGLWVMEIGGRPRQLVQAPASRYLQMPSWAPDGRSLLYACDDDPSGLFAIHQVRLDNGADTVLATGGRLSPALSHDGTMLACQNISGNLMIRHLDSGAERKLVSPLNGGGLPSRPSWSPDGHHLAFCDRNRLNHRFREGYNLIRVVDTRTGKATAYLPLPHAALSDRGDCGPVWSPDGAWMAIIMESALWVLPVRPDGTPTGEPLRLTDEPADHPSWSGDSRSLLYLSCGQLRLTSTDGRKPRTIPVSLRWSRRLPPRSEITRLHAGRLWDGTGETVRENVDIVIHGNRITAVEPHRPGAARTGERQIDASQATVIPGLWDSHTHPWQYCYGGRQNSLMLAYGITTNVSMGGFAYEEVRLRESLAAGAMTGPRLFATGELIDGSRTAYSHCRAHRTQDGVRRTLERAVALDYDFVKTYVRAPAWIMTEATRTAHERLGVLTGSHLCTPGLGLGQDLTSHLQATQRLDFGHVCSATRRSYQDVEELYHDGEYQILVTPFTASPLVGADPKLANDPRVTALMPPWDTTKVKKEAGHPPTSRQMTALRREMGVYRKIIQDGGTLALGTDAALVPIGLHLHLALRALHQYARLTPAQALRTATVTPARLFGVGDDLGTIEPGKIADLTVIDGDPFRDFSDLVRTSMVLRDGIVHRQQDLVSAFTTGPDGAERPDRPKEVHWLALGDQLRAGACCTP
ncbi:MAG: PD40 domain-containing protein [Streptomycetaceae bacterium]|nr:PD40 domain-containing protein [Streptomycetaceae bacterium]